MFSPKSSSSSSIYDSDLRLVDTGQALSYRFIRSIGLSDLPIIWFNLYPSRNRSGFLWYPTTWALICRHRASISSSSWDLPRGLYQSFMETEVGSSVVIIDNCSLVMSKDILILWSSSILETPNEYLTFILKIQTSDLSRNALKVAHCQADHEAVQSTSNFGNLHAGIPNLDVGTHPFSFFDLSTIHLPHHGTQRFEPR